MAFRLELQQQSTHVHPDGDGAFEYPLSASSLQICSQIEEKFKKKGETEI
jgi:hypothetical protein